MRYFKRFANKAFVKGKDKSAIYNFPGRNILFVPNALVDFVNEIDGISEEEMFDPRQGLSDKTIRSYVNFLLKEKLGFYTTLPTCFPPISTQYEKPYDVNRASIEFIDKENYQIASAVEELAMLGCRHLDLRLLSTSFSPDLIMEVLSACESGPFRSVVLMYGDPTIREQLSDRFLEQFKKVSRIVTYNAKKDITLEDRIPTEVLHRNAYSPKRVYETHVIDLDFFAEAQHFNPYYNMRICVTGEGEIKNCLNQHQGFGYFERGALSSTLTDADFKILWHATPDRISGLRESELRYAYYSNRQLTRIAEEEFEYITN